MDSTEKEVTEKSEEKLLKIKKKNDALMDKKRNGGLSNMYRTASRNHVSYITIGDRRANILIGTCTLIISVTFTIFLRKFDEPTIYLIPGVLLIITCTTTMILAIFSTRPDNTRGYYTIEEVLNKPVNLLYFENFYKMSIQEYETAMDKLIESGTDSRHALMVDLHSLGVSVARKYRFLRMSYDVLMVGVVLTVLAFFGAMIWHY